MNVLFIVRKRIVFIIMFEIVFIRVDESTKRKMNRLRHVNWSEVMREAILKKIEEEYLPVQIIMMNMKMNLEM